jgi:anaerobic selenocysteine-containing dehydrogenase
VRAYVNGGELVAVAADPDPCFGNLCERGRLAPKIIYSPDRIRTPLVRSGPKGKIQFRQATWDEALSKIAEQFMDIRNRYGARALVSYMGAGTLEDGLSAFFKKMLEPFGSPNDIDCGSVCYVSSRILAPLTTLGIEGDAVTPDFENASSIILWGTNPLKDGIPDKMKRIREGEHKGASLIVVDPRRTSLARKADLWVPLLPGTDGALALALINIIIQRKWFDQGFVEQWTLGFDELASYACEFTPERTGKICGLDPVVILRLAEAFALGSRSAMDFYSGLEYAPSGVQNTRALYSLAALSGNLDVDGGLYIHAYPHALFQEYECNPAIPPLGAREFPLFYALAGRAHISGLPDAVLHDDPYPVRGLLLVGGSPYLSYPDSARWKQVYDRLDFIAVVDRFMPEEAAWADVILPAATYYEIESYHLYRDHGRMRRRVIEPVGEARNDSMILSAIAERLGYGSSFPGSEEEIVDRAFSNNRELLRILRDDPGVAPLPFGERRTRKYDSGHLRSDGKPGFPTPSGKFEFTSALLDRYGYDALPVYIDPRASTTDDNSMLMLTTGARTRKRFNSQYLDRRELAINREPALEINSIDAEIRGIKNGDLVSLRTDLGEIVLEARVTTGICQGAVHAPFGGGSRRHHGLWRQAHVNSVIPSHVRDPISGYPVVKAVMCDVAKIFTDGDICDSVSECIEYVENNVNSSPER